MKKPLPLSEVRRRVNDPKTRIVAASQEAIGDLQPYVDSVLTALKKVCDVEGAWVSDASCLSDFFDFFRDRSQDQRLYDQIGEELGVPLERANADDHFIVRIALKLKRRAEAPS